MKAIRQILAGAAALALIALASCSKEETNDEPVVDNGNTEEPVAEYASISSEDSGYTATDGGGSILFGPDGGQVTITVNANVEWNVTQEGADWLDVGVGTSSGIVTVYADPTDEEENRTAVLTFYKTSDGSSFAVVDITQTTYDIPQITVDVDSWQAPAKGALTATIVVEANFDWDLEDVTVNWLSAEKTGDGLLLTADENEKTEERETEVTLTSSNGATTVSVSVTVVQDAAVYLTVGEESLSFESEEDSATVTVESNYEWGFSFDSSVDWLGAQAGDGVLTLTVAKYSEDGTRECIVTLTAGDGVENVAEAQLTVSQSGKNPATMILEYTSGGGEIILPLSGTVDCTVDWGDGSELEAVTSALPSHSYDAAGVYNVKVSGTVTELNSQSISTSVSVFLTDIIQWGKTGLTGMDYAFSKCYGLKHLPADTEGSLSEVEEFYYTFTSCTALETVDVGLFANATSSSAFYGVFNGCTALESLPDGLFSGCSAATNFRDAFLGCSALKAIGKNFFNGCSAVTTFQRAFGNCTSLTDIPADIFTGCTAVTSMQDVFTNCSSLTEIPEGLFDDVTACTSFYEAFYKCTSLKTIPASLFAKNTAVTTFYSTFENCSSLTEVPASLFANNSAVTTVSGLFENCTSLTSLPEGLLDSMTKLDTATFLCYGCTALVSVPASLFDNCTKLTTMNGTFRDCLAMTCESPYTTVNGNKVHLYERSGYSSTFSTIKSYTKCFSGCTNMADYSQAEAAGWVD